jgi:acetyl-CoA carboxylase carboxyl transferase subunit beta
MKNFLDERRKRLETFQNAIRKNKMRSEPLDIPDGLFIKCEHCGAALYERSLTINQDVCPKCDYHFKISADKRLFMLVDENTFSEIDHDLISTNPLTMPGYEDKISASIQLTKMNEAFKSGVAKIVNIEVAIGVLDSHFMMGSMGSVVGEKVTNLIELATKKRLPLIIVTASGGARMQEGIFSLMQMAKTAAALKRHDQQGLLFISVLTNPTTGGVAASFASLGDIIIAEKSALIGFAGARVIKQTIKEDLPVGFQTETFQLEHGQVDLIAHRKELRKTIYRLLVFHQGGEINE